MGESDYTSIIERTTNVRNIINNYLFHFVKCSSQYCQSTILAILCTGHVINAMVSLFSFSLVWVFLCPRVLEDIYSNDFITIFYFSYPYLCLNRCLYEGVMSKVDIANKIYSMVFAIHGQLGIITYNDICHFLT